MDGAAVPARAGYTVCGDEDKAWAKAEGTLPNRPGTTFKLDGSLAKRAGAPLVGSTSFVLDGTGELSSAGGVDRITFTALEYEPGDYLPRSGVVLIETAGGRRFRARFLPVFWKLGKAEVTVDTNAPVEVPIVQ